MQDAESTMSKIRWCPSLNTAMLLLSAAARAAPCGDRELRCACPSRWPRTRLGSDPPRPAVFASPAVAPPGSNSPRGEFAAGSLRTTVGTSGFGNRAANSTSSSRLDLPAAASKSAAWFSSVSCGASRRTAVKCSRPVSMFVAGGADEHAFVDRGHTVQAQEARQKHSSRPRSVTSPVT
jgi:hypothetical protein